MTTNTQTKEEVDKIVAKYDASFRELENKRDKIVADFIEALRQKKLEELKQKSNQL